VLRLRSLPRDDSVFRGPSSIGGALLQTRNVIAPLTARVGAVILAAAMWFPLACGHGRAYRNVEHADQVMVFPDTEDHVTLVADLT